MKASLGKRAKSIVKWTPWPYNYQDRSSLSTASIPRFFGVASEAPSSPCAILTRAYMTVLYHRCHKASLEAWRRRFRSDCVFQACKLECSHVNTVSLHSSCSSVPRLVAREVHRLVAAVVNIMLRKICFQLHIDATQVPT